MSSGIITSVQKKELNNVAKTVRLQLTQPVTLNIIGKVTGKRYHFPGGGSIVYVDERDVNGLLEKKTTGGCCGNPFPPQPYFYIVR